MNMTTQVSRGQAILVNRITISSVVAMALASYFWQPARLIEYIADVVLRAYLHFVAGSMAHESTHGHLGNTRSSNFWWGRLALLPSATPFVTFRKTHLQHHAATNVPERDPDEFMNTRRCWEIPIRALLLPSHWVLWLWKHGRLTGRDVVEYVLTCAVQAATFGALAYVTGLSRVVTGFLASATIHSVVLWYFFAVKTHEGYSTGAAVTRSHNYYGRLLYRATFGLSMHRLHHMQPGLAWTQMANQVPSGTKLQRLLLQRDIRYI
jgi:beta-carotene hydroxylase